MKNWISILIVLGAVVSTQAQFRSFNFSCGHEATNAQVVINLDGYSADQLAILGGLGFTEGTSQISGQPILVGTISGRNLTVSHVPAGINVAAGVVEGVGAGTYYFRVSGGNGFTNLYAITANELIGIIQSLDLDNDGFTHEEEEELDLSGFADDNGTYQYFYTPPSATGFYITVYPEGNNLFEVYDDDGAITAMTGLTLREAVDYVRGLPVGQGTGG